MGELKIGGIIMKTLIFLINDVDNCQNFIKYAFDMASDLKFKLKILNVIYPYTFGTYGYVGSESPPSAEHIKQIEINIKGRVISYISEIDENAISSGKVEYISKIGDAPDVLEEMCIKGEVNYVVLQGKADGSFWSQRPEIMEIIQKISCPVMIISPNSVYEHFKKVIYATDYNSQDIDVLNKLVKITEPMQSQIVALHIFESVDFEEKIVARGFREILKKKVDSPRVTARYEVNNDNLDVVEMLETQAEHLEADIIVVLKENRNLFEKIFKSSFTAKLLKTTKLPVIVYQSKK